MSDRYDLKRGAVVPVVQRITSATAEVSDALGVLLPQLGGTEAPTYGDVERFLSSPGAFLLIARDPAGQIRGALSLVKQPRLTESLGWIDDVVVDEVARGRGFGRALVEAAMSLARAEGVARLRLTSRNHRYAAHALYRSAGFEVKDTSVFNLDL